MTKPFMVERAPLTSTALAIVGMAIALLGLYGLMVSGSLDLWGLEYLLAILGVLFFMVGVYWLLTYTSRVRRFHILLEENRKAVFIKNLDDVEYLAWRLPTKFESELAEKKRQMGVK